jgi:cyclophilin family peptidyl-prolyl cis-trans isomerase
MRRAAALIVGALLAACSATPSPTPPPCPTEPPTQASSQATLADAATATVTVSGAVSGTFAIKLVEGTAPIATANFVALARCGFYDGIWFHRVLAGFVIQVGDPGTRTHDGDFEGIGQGGPGYGFEIEPPEDNEPFDDYTVAMANNTVANGSQWFVTLADLDDALRSVGTYTILGDVVTGLDVIDAIAAVPVNDPQIGIPLELVRIDHIAISAAPAESPSDD